MATGSALAYSQVENTTHPASKTSGAFLGIAPGVRAVGMGESFTAVADDASAAYWNPGGIGQVRSLSGMAVYDAMGNGMGLSCVSAVLPVEDFVAGFAVSAFTFGDYDARDANGLKQAAKDLTELGVNAALAGPSPVSAGWLGVSLGLVREASGRAIAGIGAGTVIPFPGRTSIGLSVQHVGLTSNRLTLPAIMRGGLSYDLAGKGKVSIDAGYGLLDAIPWMSLGGEYAVAQIFVIRGGYKLRLKDEGMGGLTGLTVGMGIRFGGAGIDYAYQPFGDLMTTHRIGLLYTMPPLRALAGTTSPAETLGTGVEDLAQAPARTDEGVAATVSTMARPPEGIPAEAVRAPEPQNTPELAARKAGTSTEKPSADLPAKTPDGTEEGVTAAVSAVAEPSAGIPAETAKAPGLPSRPEPAEPMARTATEEPSVGMPKTPAQPVTHATEPLKERPGDGKEDWESGGKELVMLAEPSPSTPSRPAGKPDEPAPAVVPAGPQVGMRHGGGAGYAPVDEPAASSSREGVREEPVQAGGEAERNAPARARIVAPAPDLKELMATGTAQYDAGDYEGALDILKVVVRGDPLNWSAWQMIGNCHYMKRERDAALTAYNRSLMLNPDNTALRDWVARIVAADNE